MRSSKTWGLLAAVLVVGCGGVKDPNAPELGTFDASGAAVGSTGKLRIDLRNVAWEDVTVSLSVLDSTIATVPATATVKAGAQWVDVDYTAVKLGETMVTAKVGATELTAWLTVVDAITLEPNSGTPRLQAGASYYASVWMNVTLPAAATVTLASSDPAVATVPASVTVPAFGAQAYFMLRGVATGMTQVTATYGDQTVKFNVYVTAEAPRGYAQLWPSSRVLRDSQAFLYLSVDMTPAADVPATIRSLNPAVVTAPATATIPAGSSSSFVPLTLMGSGGAQLEVQYGTRVITVQLYVFDSNALSSLSCTSSMTMGSSYDCYVSLMVYAQTDSIVTLSQRTGGILGAPASVVVPAGASDAYFRVTAAAVGTDLLTATLGTSTRSQMIAVNPPSATGILQQLSQVNSAGVGQMAGITVYLSQTAQAPVTVTLSSSNPAVLALPPSIEIPMASSSATVFAPVQALGFTVVTATVGTNRVTLVALYQSPQPDFSASYNSSPCEIGYADDLRVYAYNLPTTDTPVTVTTATPGIVDVSSSAIIRAGQSYLRLPVRAIGAGTTAMRVTVGTETFGFTARVVDAAKISQLIVNIPSVGVPGTLYVYLDAVLARSVVVTLTQTGEGALQLPATVTLNPGAASLGLNLAATKAGPVEVTASIPGSTLKQTITIGP